MKRLRRPRARGGWACWVLRVYGQLLTFQVVGNLVRHLLRLPAGFFEKRHLGDILSRIIDTLQTPSGRCSTVSTHLFHFRELIKTGARGRKRLGASESSFSSRNG
jgi:hypothetical protein